MRTEADADAGSPGAVGGGPAPDLTVRLVGRWSVATGGGLRLDERELAGRQGRLVLAYLACHRTRPVARAELVELLWPDGVPRSSATALAAVVSKVRTALVAAGVTDPVGCRAGCYRLRPAVWVDVEAAEQAAGAAVAALASGATGRARELADAAIATAEQPVLPGIEREWIDAVRRSMRVVLASALRTRVEACLVGGDPRAAVDSAEALLAFDPLDEAGHRGVIVARSALGERAAALRAYERCRAVLAEELGADPSPPTEAAFLAALRTTPTGPHDRLPLPPMLTEVDLAPLVGRESALALLNGLLDDELLDGRRGVRVGLVTGDPGIGKTRMVQEFARAAHLLGVAVLFGRCDEEPTSPYQPFVEALTHLVRAWPTPRNRDHRDDELAGIWPAELSRLVPAAATARGLPAPAAPTGPFGAPSAGSGLDTEHRFALFEAVRVLLCGLSRRSPVVLAIDDVHWADRSTLRLLRHLTRAEEPAAVAVVLCCRDNEVTEQHPVTAVVAELDRLHRVARVPLAALTRQQVATLLGPQRGRTDEVHRLTAGNPFFVREVMRSLAEHESADLTQGRLPVELTALVTARLARLRRGTTASLRVAAVAGQRFEVPVVAAAAGYPQQRVLADVEDAVTHRLVTEDAERPDAFWFTHDIVRRALAERLSAGRRARLHRDLGVALESRAGVHVGELARHFVAAVAADPELGDRAARYAELAGQAAEAQSAHEVAADHYATALGISEPTPARRAALTLALARVRGLLGEPVAVDTYLAAADLARAAGEPGLLAEAALGLSGIWTRSGETDPRRTTLLHEALTAVGPEPSALGARMLARLAGQGYWDTDRADAVALARQAVAVARSAGDPATIAECLDISTYLSWGPSGAADRLSAAREIVDWARRAGDLEAELRGHGWGITAAAQLCSGPELDKEIAAYTALARQLRQPRYLWYALTRRAMRAIMTGDGATGERLMCRARSITERAPQPDAEFVRHSVLAPLWLERRDADAARTAEAFSTATDADFGADSSPARVMRCAAITLDLACGRATEAENLLAPFTPEAIDRLPSDFTTGFVLASLAGAACVRGDPACASAVSARLLPLAQYGLVWAGGVSFWGAAAHWLGALARTQGRLEDAQHWLVRAASAHQRAGARTWLARTWLEQARLARARHEHAPAETLLRRAATVAGQLDARALAAEITQARARPGGTQVGGRGLRGAGSYL